MFALSCEIIWGIIKNKNIFILNDYLTLKFDMVVPNGRRMVKTVVADDLAKKISMAPATYIALNTLITRKVRVLGKDNGFRFYNVYVS